MATVGKRFGGNTFMGSGIIDLLAEPASPGGRYLLAREQALLDQAVADMFGFHALQLGLPQLGGLSANRMPHRWLACEHPASGAALLTDFSALPFPAESLDLVLMLHALESTNDPHAALREVHRVLMPEGRVVVAGLNPVSLWALRRGGAERRWWGGGAAAPSTRNEWIGYWRLRDWLRLLGFEVESAQFGCYRPAMASEKWFARLRWMEAMGQRWWPIFGAMYFVVAVKRVPGMRLLSPAWRTAGKRQVAPVSVANNSVLAGDDTGKLT